ncbi:hypothetical protein [Companilactobacillus mishanensis]|uniref:Uncharacterized protein n=1 Tax=Companilactobacillus mishanensis TaxID=2486008 RepID=A0A5P0ZF19_9LACO|nr:hypothetical protein [Companilactobacillus mishanensis]MQS44250.1 hypothetical protein [Companilactobacillus mishanensis]MQS51646.1 hypothetical protein [Companilactobacillus mishanensis]
MSQEKSEDELGRARLKDRLTSDGSEFVNSFTPKLTKEQQKKEDEFTKGAVEYFRKQMKQRKTN